MPPVPMCSGVTWTPTDPQVPMDFKLFHVSSIKRTFKAKVHFIVPRNDSLGEGSAEERTCFQISSEVHGQGQRNGFLDYIMVHQGSTTLEKHATFDKGLQYCIFLTYKTTNIHKNILKNRQNQG